MARGQGFTLIEVVIVLAVIGILSAIAFPAYMEYVRKARITEATNQLATMRAQLEQYYQDNGNYGSTASACGGGLGSLDGESFTFSCNWGGGGNNQAYLLSATGKAAQGMNGYTFTLNEKNTRQTTAFPGAADLPKDCWLTSAGQTC